MATEIVIPNVGESVTEGVIASWLKSDGDWVEQDETVLELETDKITMEVPAPAAGVLKRGAAEGDTVEVGAAVGTVDETAEKPVEEAEADAGASAEREEAPAEAGGQGQATASGQSQDASPGRSGRADATATDSGSRAMPAGAEASSRAGATRNGEVRATPLAEKIAEQFGVDLGSITATGAGDRVREQDVLAYIQSHQEAQGGAGASASSPAAPSRGVGHEPMSPLRQRIAARLVEAQQTAAMLTTFNEIDMTAVMALRKRYKEPFGEKHGVGLGFMSFFVSAACSALAAFPRVNAYVVEHEGKPAIQTHDYCDVAIAVSSKKGLVVPVVRSAETLSFAEIESSIKDLAERAQKGQLDLSELEGGTFTITNGGIFGSLLSTPILNPPQSAILGMHAIKNRAIEHPDRPGEIALRPMMYVALSYDHRIVDGAEAVSFLRHIKEAIEDPSRLLIGV